MRFKISTVLSLLALITVGLLCLDWGTYLDKKGYKYSNEGWGSVLPAKTLFPYWIGNWQVDNFFILVTIGSAAIVSWLRAFRIRLSRKICWSLTFYAMYHMAVVVWYFVEGYMDMDFHSGDIIKTWTEPGGYLALVVTVIAFVTSLFESRQPKVYEIDV